MTQLSKQEKADRLKAYLRVFGAVNGNASKRDGKKTMRAGKTAQDKVKGHIPYTKNRRVWDSKSFAFVKV